MKWIKRGQIFKPNNSYDWSHSYAQIPRPLILNDRIRIYYATRHFDNKGLPISETSFIDVDRHDLSKILYIHDKPSLNLGGVGTFSHFGIHPTMLLNHDNKILFYYQGWNRCLDLPYETSVGLAVSMDDGYSFTNTSDLPTFGKSPEDPYFVNGVFIIENQSKYLMWYSSGKGWIESGNKLESIYQIKHAVSDDLISWERNTFNCISTKFEDECQNSATVVKIDQVYHMWFCYRHAIDFRDSKRGYRIGYACSKDMVVWNRKDAEAGIDISFGESWDSQMVCYPYVFKIDNRILMLYCGNYFGKEGFGFAELDLN